MIFNLTLTLEVNLSVNIKADVTGRHIVLLKQQKKKDFCTKMEFSFPEVGLVHQYGCDFFVLEHQCGRRDVM